MSDCGKKYCMGCKRNCKLKQKIKWILEENKDENSKK